MVASQNEPEVVVTDELFNKSYLIGGGIGSLAAAAFLVRDGGVPGGNITIFETLPVVGGSMDAGGSAETGYSMRGGRMFTSDNYECTWALFKSIPSVVTEGISVYDETRAFNETFTSNSKARLVDRNVEKVDVETMGFSMEDRLQLLRLVTADEKTLGSSRITDQLPSHFFTTNFWYMWATTFAFQPWHSAVEFKRYLHRFMLEFPRIATLAGVKRTEFNQYDSLVLPLVAWLKQKGVLFVTDCTVVDLDTATVGGHVLVTAIHCVKEGRSKQIAVRENDLVFFQNGSMTDASSLGSMTSAPAKLTKQDTHGWDMWEKLAKGRSTLGNPNVFNSSISESFWESFTITLRDTEFFDRMESFSGNEAGTGNLVTFKDSNWLMSIVLPHQPHFSDQPANVQVFWGYALHPERIGNYVAKPMSECNGAEILAELCAHLNFDISVVSRAICIPCRMPYITSMFMPRNFGDRPLPVPKESKNLAFISQFVEIPGDVVFTVEYSVRAAQMAVYQLLHIDLEVPPITRYDKSLQVELQSAIKAFA